MSELKYIENEKKHSLRILEVENGFIIFEDPSSDNGMCSGRERMWIASRDSLSDVIIGIIAGIHT